MSLCPCLAQANSRHRRRTPDGPAFGNMSVQLRKLEVPPSSPQERQVMFRTHACALYDSYDQQCSSTREPSTRSRFQQSPISHLWGGVGEPNDRCRHLCHLCANPANFAERRVRRMRVLPAAEGCRACEACTGAPASLFLLTRRRRRPAAGVIRPLGNHWWLAMIGVAQEVQFRRKPCKGKG